MTSRRTLLRRGVLLATALLLFTGVTGCYSDGPVVQPPVKPPHTTRPTLFEVRRGPPSGSQRVAVVLVLPGTPQYGQECASGMLMPIMPGDDWLTLADLPPDDWCTKYGPTMVDPFTADWLDDPNNTMNVQPCPPE